MVLELESWMLGFFLFLYYVKGEVDGWFLLGSRLLCLGLGWFLHVLPEVLLNT